IAVAGTPQVTVVNPAPGGGTSNALTFTISTTPPPPPPPNTVTFGETNILSGTDANNAAPVYFQSNSYSLTQTGTLTSLSFYVRNAAGQLNLGVYADNNGLPGALLAQTGAFIATTGWNTVNVQAPLSLPVGTYWLAWLASDNAMTNPVAGTGIQAYSATP